MGILYDAFDPFGMNEQDVDFQLEHPDAEIDETKAEADSVSMHQNTDTDYIESIRKRCEKEESNEFDIVSIGKVELPCSGNYFDVSVTFLNNILEKAYLSFRNSR